MIDLSKPVILCNKAGLKAIRDAAKAEPIDKEASLMVDPNCLTGRVPIHVIANCICPQGEKPWARYYEFPTQWQTVNNFLSETVAKHDMFLRESGELIAQWCREEKPADGMRDILPGKGRLISIKHLSVPENNPWLKGRGYWATATQYDPDSSVYSVPPKWATHVLIEVYAGHFIEEWMTEEGGEDGQAD